MTLVKTPADPPSATSSGSICDALLADSGPFRVVFEKSPEGMMLVDPHDPVIVAPIIACNESAARMNGYPSR